MGQSRATGAANTLCLGTVGGPSSQKMAVHRFAPTLEQCPCRKQKVVSQSVDNK